MYCVYVNLYIKLIQMNTQIFAISSDLFKGTPFSLTTFQHISKLNSNTLVQAHQYKIFIFTFPTFLFLKSNTNYREI